MSRPKKQKPVKSQKITQQEFEKAVLDLTKQGLTSEKIGEKLRGQGIHSKEHSKKISQILKEANHYVDPELKNRKEKLSKIQKHCEKNKQDKKAIREKERVFSQIRKIKKYLKV